MSTCRSPICWVKDFSFLIICIFQQVSSLSGSDSDNSVWQIFLLEVWSCSLHAKGLCHYSLHKLGFQHLNWFILREDMQWSGCTNPVILENTHAIPWKVSSLKNHRTLSLITITVNILITQNSHVNSTRARINSLETLWRRLKKKTTNQTQLLRKPVGS